MLNFAQVAAFERFAKGVILQLQDDFANKKISNFGKSPINASGAASRSLEYRILEDGIEIVGNDYIYYLVYGRKPTGSGGSGSGGETLYERILKWIDQKPVIYSGISKKSLAFLIARKIHREGTTIYRQHRGDNSGLLDDAINDDAILELQDDLGDSLIEYVSSEILKGFTSVSVTADTQLFK